LEAPPDAGLELDVPLPPAEEFEDVDAGVALELADVVVAEAEVSRRRSLLLPLSLGVISETKFSAAVTPVTRTVFSTMPGTAFAVRMGPVIRAVDGTGAVRRRQNKPAAANITTAMMRPTHRALLEGCGGVGWTISGQGACGSGRTAGAGAKLIQVIYL
jgi:hypothetical protein